MKIFKKSLSLLLILTVLLQSVLILSSFSAGVTYSDPALMESSDAASYEPYPIKSNATRYTPWLTMYHMQRADDADKGLRGGEGGQMIMSAAVSPVNPNLVLFGTDMGGLWRSTDGGENWYSVTNNINMRAVMGIEFHPTKENLVYCIQSVKGTGYAKSMKNTSMDGLYRSKDGGRTWEQVLHALFLVNGASQELIQFDDSGNLYVLSREGVYKSTDDGENFTLIGTPDAGASVDDSKDEEDKTDDNGDEIAVDESTSGGVFALWVSGDGKNLITATSTSGISLSTNGGTSWVTKNVSANTTGAYSVAVDPKDEAHWYAIFTGETASRLYETKDSGTSWSPINSDYYAAKNKAMVVKISYPGDGNTRRLHLVYTNAARHYRYSDNGGTSWKNPDNVVSGGTDITQDTFTKSTGYNTEALEICSSNPDIVFFSYGDVMYKSTDGGKTFFWSNAGYSGNYANGFVFDSQGRLWIPFTDRAMAVTDAAYAKGTYPTATKVIENATIGAVGIDPTNENNIYVSSGGWSNQTLYKSTDGGSTWTQVIDANTGKTIPDKDNTEKKIAFKVIHFHNTNSNIIYAGKYKSTDGGKSWTELSYNIKAVSPLDNDILYAAAPKSQGAKNTVFRSTDSGSTWTEIITPYSNAVAIMADKFDKDIFWVGGYGGYVFKCTSAGSYTAYSKDNGLTPMGDATNGIYSLAQDPNNANHLLAGTNGPDGKTKTTGLYETTDGGAHWHVVKGLPSARNIQTLEFTPAGDEVLIGTCSQGTMIYDFKKYELYRNGTLTVDKSDEILLASDADKYRVMVNKNTVSFTDSEMPYLANGEIYVPAKKVLEEAGYSVNVNGNAVTASKEYVTYSISADSTAIAENGEELTLSNTPQLKNDILFVPQSFFNLCMDLEAEYDSTLRRVGIESVPVLTVSYSYGDSTTPKTEYVKTGAAITLEKELTRPGYEVSHWTDANGNTYALGSQVTITADTTFTAVWKRSNNAKFLEEKENTYYPSGMVAITDVYNATDEKYTYNVDYQKDTSTVSKLVNNVKVSSTTYRDRRYAALKFDLTGMNEISSVKLKLQASKVDNEGTVYIYEGSGVWENEFGSTKVSQGGTGSFEDKAVFPTMGSTAIASSTKSSSTAREIDLTDYIKSQSGKEYVILYVVYHIPSSNSRKNLDGGFRMYNMNKAKEYRPQLIVNELTEVESLTQSGTIYAQADIEGKTGIPVIAYFKESENGVLVLQNAVIGDSTTDTTKQISMDIEFADGEKPVVKFFIWNGKDSLVPLMASQTIAAE